MSIEIVGLREFEAAWDSSPDTRYSYVLNMPLMMLYAVLVSGFWCYWSISGVMGGFDWVLIAMGLMFVCVTGWVAVNVLYWRHFNRMSAVVITSEQILWRHGKEAWARPWKEIDFDTLGLLDVDISERKYEHHLVIGGEKLYLYRPHVRMLKMEEFVQHLLLNLQANGRMPKGKNDGKRKKKGGLSR